MILHILNRSPFSSTRLQDCLRRAASGDCLLLLGDGVYGATVAASQALAGHPFAVICALQPDLESRGLMPHLAPEIRVVDYDQFVALCCEADNTLSWY